MNALCLVAHPDDCLIFGYSYIYAHPEYTWTVGYLTCTPDSPRGQELDRFWQKKNIKTVFLGFHDDWKDQQTQSYNFWDPAVASQSCMDLASNFDLVLTHDRHGDYGHIHHKLVHNSVKNFRPLVTFSPHGQGDIVCSVPINAYDLNDLPMHRAVIEPFHLNGHHNSYKVIL
jgi:LmbE family N-acetylglucosaminyl deacetylase